MKEGDAERRESQLMRTGKEVLVPLTSSLYVPGKLADTDMVVVDIGTGYYVRKVSSPPSSFPPYFEYRYCINLLQ